MAGRSAHARGETDELNTIACRAQTALRGGFLLEDPMRTGVIPAVILAALFLFSFWPAQAQMMRCGLLASIEKTLRDKYQEHPVQGGPTLSGFFGQLYATPDGSTWTFIVKMRNGRACLLASGENWRATAAGAPGEES